MYGWAGKILRINLTDKSINEETIEESLLQRYIGGRGLGARVLYDEVGPGTEPLSPDNLLIFAAGPLTGTKAPSSSRYSMTTKSPLTGTICDANSGGKFGVFLKKCGLDAIIISGKSDKPVYITVFDKNVEIKDASHLWGKDTQETVLALKASEGGDISINCIGPAGENLVLISCVINDGSRALARGGGGAVMGSKNLKAVAVRGTGNVEVADPDFMKFMTYEANKLLKAHPITSKGLPELGSSMLVNVMNRAGIYPSRNFQNSTFDKASELSGETVADRLVTGKTGCRGCLIRCRRKIKTGNFEGEGPEYESSWALGPNCGIDDIEILAKANDQCARLGLDTISTGGTLACAMEMTENGVVDAGIRFGEKEKLLTMLQKIAFRDGFGDELAEGSWRFSEKYNVPQYAMQVKGLELPGYDPRGAQGQGLGYATSNRGGCHLRGGYMIGPEVLGTPRLINRISFIGKAGHTVQLQNIGAAADSLVVCRFAMFALSDNILARLLSAVTGIQYAPEDLMRAGERIFSIERLYNLREGFSGSDDILPSRLLNEPVKSGPVKGNVVHLEEMLKEYYEFRSWDENGIPKLGKLKELGLESIRNGS